MALMRRLNESASFFSEVSNLSEDDVADPEPQRGAEDMAHLYGDGKCLYLAEMLNESATWIDCDISESDREDGSVSPNGGGGHAQQQHPGPPQVSAKTAVARSFSY